MRVEPHGSSHVSNVLQHGGIQSTKWGPERGPKPVRGAKTATNEVMGAFGGVQR